MKSQCRRSSGTDTASDWPVTIQLTPAAAAAAATVLPFVTSSVFISKTAPCLPKSAGEDFSRIRCHLICTERRDNYQRKYKTSS